MLGLKKLNAGVDYDIERNRVHDSGKRYDCRIVDCGTAGVMAVAKYE